MSKKKPVIIKETPEDGFVDDQSFQNMILNHVKVFGFHDVVGNIIEAYRQNARRYNKQADELEKQFNKGKPKY